MERRMERSRLGSHEQEWWQLLSWHLKKTPSGLLPHSSASILFPSAGVQHDCGEGWGRAVGGPSVRSWISFFSCTRCSLAKRSTISATHEVCRPTPSNHPRQAPHKPLTSPIDTPCAKLPCPLAKPSHTRTHAHADAHAHAHTPTYIQVPYIYKDTCSFSLGFVYFVTILFENHPIRPARKVRLSCFQHEL